MGDKLVLFLVLLVFLTNEVLTMLGMFWFLTNGRIFFAIIGMFCLHFYAAETTEIFKRLISLSKKENK